MSEEDSKNKTEELGISFEPTDDEARYGGQWICPDCHVINFSDHCHNCHRKQPKG